MKARSNITKAKSSNAKGSTCNVKLKNNKVKAKIIELKQVGLARMSTKISWHHFHMMDGDAPPNSFMDSNASPKLKTMKGDGVRTHSLA